MANGRLERKEKGPLADAKGPFCIMVGMRDSNLRSPAHEAVALLTRGALPQSAQASPETLSGSTDLNVLLKRITGLERVVNAIFMI